MEDSEETDRDLSAVNHYFQKKVPTQIMDKQQSTKKDIERKKREAKARGKMCETSLCENINKKCDKVNCHDLKYNFPHFKDICLNTRNVKPWKIAVDRRKQGMST